MYIDLSMSLRVYNRKRKFNETPEPKGKKASSKGQLRFVVQMHDASRLHFDFRLEFDGVFKSWAVPKGPSLNPQDQRLAVFVEDHPLDYGSFEGIIPKGNYGAGTVMVWDEGTYIERGSSGRGDSEAAMKKNFEKGHITFVLSGQKLRGEFALIKLKDGKAWLLVKKRDEYSTYKTSAMFTNDSVKTGRTIEQIAAEAEGDGDIWLPKKGKTSKLKRVLPVRRTKALPSKREAVVAKVAAKSKAAAKIGSHAQGKVGAHRKSAVEKFSSGKVVAEGAQAALLGRHPRPKTMPRKVKPMIATLARKPADKSWIVDPSLGGLRAIAEVEGKKVSLYSKAGLSFNKKFAAIADELRGLNVTAVFDGEIVDNKFNIFDLLYFKGQDLRHKPLGERKAILKSAFHDGKLVKHLGQQKTKQQIAKNPDSVYKSGTTSDWQIVTNAKPTKVAAGEHAKVRAATAAAAGTSANSKKLRTAKEAKHHKTTAAAGISSSLDQPRLTNLDKIFFPDDGLTKGDIIHYYDSIADYILPYLKDRPESMNRQPNGIAKPGFYQKDLTGHIPRWLKTKRFFSESADKSIDYLVCQDKRSLLYMINLGVIEIHPWFSRIQKPENPDFLVIDLDPDGNNFDHVIKIAHEFHDILDDIGADNYVKTSGSTGIHIGVPLAAKYDFDEAREFAEQICKYVAKNNPALTSIDRNPNRRRKKIYLDFMQNRRGQTLAAPFCIRPKKGAPVSMPLEWKELEKGVRPEDFNIHNAKKRIEKLKDPWKNVLGPGVDLKKCTKAFQKKYLRTANAD